MLALSPRLNYIHEPFNPGIASNREICKVQFHHYFTYICDENESEYLEAIKQLLEGRYNLPGGLLSVRSLRGFAKTIGKWRKFTVQRSGGVVPLIKDPIALMSMDWLNRRFDMHTIVMIRHPAAFVSSMKRLGYASHPEKWALSQPLLMRDYLEPFEKEINALQKEKHGVIERAALTWKMHHYVISQYQKEHNDWCFLRHEDISQNPVDVFEQLYRGIGITFSPEIKQKIDEHSNKSNPERAPGKERSIKLNSQENIFSWKYRLTPAEIEAVRERVDEVATYFYSDQDWAYDNEDAVPETMSS
jgi:hypothetical protein